MINNDIIRSHSMVWRILAALLLSALLYSQVLGQAQPVLNGADITLVQSAYLVIDNPVANAPAPADASSAKARTSRSR